MRGTWPGRWRSRPRAARAASRRSTRAGWPPTSRTRVVDLAAVPDGSVDSVSAAAEVNTRESQFRAVHDVWNLVDDADAQLRDLIASGIEDAATAVSGRSEPTPADVEAATEALDGRERRAGSAPRHGRRPDRPRPDQLTGRRGPIQRVIEVAARLPATRYCAPLTRPATTPSHSVPFDSQPRSVVEGQRDPAHRSELEEGLPLRELRGRDREALADVGRPEHRDDDLAQHDQHQRDPREPILPAHDGHAAEGRGSCRPADRGTRPSAWCRTAEPACRRAGRSSTGRTTPRPSAHDDWSGVLSIIDERHRARRRSAPA